MLEHRQKIVIGAMNLFMKYGIQSVSMDEIASSLGMSKKSLYQYMADKKEIVHEVMNFHLDFERQTIQDIAASSKNALDEMTQISKHILAFLSNMPLVLMYDLQKYYRKSFDLFHEHHMPFIQQTIKRNLDRGIQEGIYRSDINADVLSKLYVNQTQCVARDLCEVAPGMDQRTYYVEMMKYHFRGIIHPDHLSSLDLDFLDERNTLPNLNFQ